MSWACWDSASMSWSGMMVGPILMLVALVAVAAAVVYGVRALDLGRGDGSSRRSALDILKERFARGEIDRDEYEDGKRLLSAP